MADALRLSSLLAAIRNDMHVKAHKLRERADAIDCDAKNIEDARKAMLKADDEVSRLRHPDTTGQ